MRSGWIRIVGEKERKIVFLFLFFFFRTEAITLTCTTSNKVDTTFYALPSVSGMEERMQILAG